MQIFKRRPFMLCCAIFMAVSTISFFVNGKVKLTSLFIILFTSLCLLAVLFVKRHEKGLKIRLSVVLFALLMSIIAIFGSFAYFDIHGKDAHTRKAENVNVVATVIKRTSQSAYEESYLVGVESVDGETEFGRAHVLFEYASELETGDRISFNAKQISIDDVSYMLSHKLSLISDGIVFAFLCEDESDLPVTLEEDRLPVRRFFEDLNIMLSVKLKNRIDGESGNLASALLLGNRDGLRYETARDFSRGGVSHLLALSGMHLAILTGFLELLLRKTRMPKLIRCAVMIPMIVFYLALTGFAISTVRAAIMLSALYLSFIFAIPYDRLTSLFLTGALIILVSPHTVVDVGFWMSFLATFGVLLASSVDFELKKKKKGIVNTETLRGKIISSLSVTLAANIAVIALTWLAFGEFSLASPFTNLCLSPLVMILLILSLLTVLFGWIGFIGSALSFVCEVIGEVILAVLSYISAIPGITVSLEFGFVPYIIIALVTATVLCLAVKLRRKYFIFLPAALACLAYVICICVSFNFGEDRMSVTYLRRTEREMLILTQNGDAVICDMSDGNYSNLRAASELARGDGATEIDALVLTHYHDKYRVSCKRFMADETVRRLALPMPTSYEEYVTMLSLYESATEYGVEFTLYEADEALTVFGEGKLTVSERVFTERSVQPMFCIEVEYGGEAVFYLTSSYFETGKANEKYNGAETVIFGTHGPNPKKLYCIDAMAGTEELIFADRELLDLAYMNDMDGFEATVIADCEYRKFRLGKRSDE